MKTTSKMKITFTMKMTFKMKMTLKMKSTLNRTLFISHVYTFFSLDMSTKVLTLWPVSLCRTDTIQAVIKMAPSFLRGATYFPPMYVLHAEQRSGIALLLYICGQPGHLVCPVFLLENSPGFMWNFIRVYTKVNHFLSEMKIALDWTDVTPRVCFVLLINVKITFTSIFA